mmetsp:Transcript_136683/g.340849  ORF Transcript_136683/g.340849 Transcript_136683/m.340849 type:complete len:234 (-) Transcript_136683:1659-2360(-)
MQQWPPWQNCKRRPAMSVWQHQRGPVGGSPLHSAPPMRPPRCPLKAALATSVVCYQAHHWSCPMCQRCHRPRLQPIAGVLHCDHRQLPHGLFHWMLMLIAVVMMTATLSCLVKLVGVELRSLQASARESLENAPAVPLGPCPRRLMGALAPVIVMAPALLLAQLQAPLLLLLLLLPLQCLRGRTVMKMMKVMAKVGLTSPSHRSSGRGGAALSSTRPTASRDGRTALHRPRLR